jgi:hypothetical protein
MAGKTTRTRKGKQKTTTKKAGRKPEAAKRAQPKHPAQTSSKTLPPTILAPPRADLSAISPPREHVFTIQIGSISGETTIGDLIVAFPRTRAVLMKHGLRFDVEEAGYLYMTLNVFSAIHGLTTNSLVQELHTASKEPPPPPTPQQVRPIVPAPPA